MYYQLSVKQEHFLLLQPETGMGYQVVEAQMRGTELTAKFFVLNAELAIEMNDAAPLNVKQVANEGIRTVKEKAMPFRWEILRVIYDDHTIKPVHPVSESKSQFTDGSELFVRRSIYENDKRIDTKARCLLPGSYTTTLADSLRHRNNSDDPIIQLAMDHGVRGKWGYHVQPKRTDVLQRGTVDPRTGAKEVFFRNGTAPGTFVKVEAYG